MVDPCADEQIPRGRIILLNGPPRAGKSSIVTAIQGSFDGLWINLGMDRYKQMIPGQYQPGIGLRPGGEVPRLEPLVAELYQTLYECIALHSRRGINIVADIAHHDWYSTSLNILPKCAKILAGLPVLFVGVRCPIEVIMQRRIDTWKSGYQEDGSVPPAILRWQEAVHAPGIYDMEVDTSLNTPEEIASMIRSRMDKEATAFRRLAEMV